MKFSEAKIGSREKTTTPESICVHFSSLYRMMAPEPFRKTHISSRKKKHPQTTPQRERRENKENKKTILLR